jgi:hypothetical protein
MPLNINDLGKERRTFVWEYLGEEISVTYNIYQVTPEFEAELEDAIGDSEFQTQALIEMVLKVVLDWDILDGDEKIPMTVEGLQKVPTRILADVMQAIGTDSGGDETEGKSSGARSRRNRAMRRHPGGTSSRQQGSFASHPGS